MDDDGEKIVNTELQRYYDNHWERYVFYTKEILIFELFFCKPLQTFLTFSALKCFLSWHFHMFHNHISPQKSFIIKISICLIRNSSFLHNKEMKITPNVICCCCCTKKIAEEKQSHCKYIWPCKNGMMSFVRLWSYLKISYYKNCYLCDRFMLCIKELYL